MPVVTVYFQVFGVSTGAANVPTLLRDRHFQRSTVCRLQEGVRQEPGRGQNTSGVPWISCTSYSLMLTLGLSIDQLQPSCCGCKRDKLRGALEGDGSFLFFFYTYI